MKEEITILIGIHSEFRLEKGSRLYLLCSGLNHVHNVQYRQITVSIFWDFCPKIIFHSKSSWFIIKIIISPHKKSFNMFWRFHEYLLILLYKSQIFWTFLALHFECTKLHLIFNDWQVGWTQIIHNKLSLGAHMCTSEIFDLFSNMGQ